MNETDRLFASDKAKDEEPTLKNLNLVNRRTVLAFLVETDNREFWVVTNASYGAHKIAELKQRGGEPEEITFQFLDNRDGEKTLTLKAGEDKTAFVILLVKLMSGTLGIIRPGTKDVKSVTLTEGWD